MKTLAVSLLLILVLLLGCGLHLSQSSGTTPPRNCKRDCGGIEIPFPFGIEEGCHLTADFKVTCNDSSVGNSPTLTLDKVQLQIKNIDLPERVTLLTKGKMAVDPNITAPNVECINLTLPFTVSGRWTKFSALGCDTRAYVFDANVSFTGECETQWVHQEAGGGHEHGGGLGHCQTMLPDGSTSFCYNVTKISNSSMGHRYPTEYSFAALVEVGHPFNESILRNYTTLVDPVEQVGLPLAADWAVENNSSCRSHSVPNISRRGFGYVCYCKDGFEGNPYLEGGCKRTKGGNGVQYAIAGLASGVAFLGASLIYDFFAVRKLRSIRKAKFIQHGGQVLKKLISADATVGDADADATGGDAAADASDFRMDDPACITGTTNDEKPTIFTKENLQKAIKVFQKGHRVVNYFRQGGIATGGRKIYIRQFKMEAKTEGGERDKLLKEILTLRRVVHPNVAVLLGCCLETTDPLLVYDYVSDETLYDRLHENPDPQTSRFSWGDRLKIAKGTARAVACLHKRGVLHRDVRPSNILLDKACNPKLVEFGVARVLSPASYISGTIGYLDPEFTHTKQLTEKSDVYSFGVILVELLTGKDPNCNQTDQKGEQMGGSLTIHFISEFKKNLLELVVEGDILGEGEMGQLQEVAKLAESCLKLIGQDRPNMKDVAMHRCLIWKQGSGEEEPKEESQGNEGNDNGIETGSGFTATVSNVESSVTTMIGDDVRDPYSFGD